MIKKIYSQLKKMYPREYEKYKNNNWWPGTDFEICTSAILTQNTNWRNVEKALHNLKNSKINTPTKIKNVSHKKLQKIIKPAGFYKQKAKYLKNLCSYILSFDNFENFKNKVTRKKLLNVKGIGKETADSILLYGCDKKHFVIDAYTKRIFSRIGLIEKNSEYKEIKEIFENKIKSKKDYKIYHGLIVEHAKQKCKRKPECSDCAFKDLCKSHKSPKLNY